MAVAINLHNLNLISCTTFVFSSLNVEEHIWFYTSLKGKPSKQAHAESDKLMKETGLFHRAKEFPDQLSGKEFLFSITCIYKANGIILPFSDK